uniref:Clusterin-associated protein 1 n=1 Tax=Rhabditophanes sp. KR3021 TaxID=114890 RepID=A0AC35UF06_9BILA
MSYRDLRDATEILRALGFSRIVSIDNFRAPNFQLIGEILEWMVGKFDGEIRVKSNLEHESDRVIFIKQCVLILLTKARIKCNPRNLYKADGNAVKELMPALRVLYSPVRNVASDPEEIAKITDLRSTMIQNKQEVRKCNQLAVEIPQTGAELFELLNKENDLRKQRSFVLSQSLNLSQADRVIKKLTSKNEKEHDELSLKLSNISTDEASLDQKIEKRTREYEQLQKRLAKLQSFRPQYIEEYEKLEEKLKGLYGDYVVKFRTLSYLQEQVWEIERNDRDRHLDAEKNMRLAVERMKLENANPPIDVNATEIGRKMGRTIFGNILGAGLSDDDSDDVSVGSISKNSKEERDMYSETDDYPQLPPKQPSSGSENDF